MRAGVTSMPLRGEARKRLGARLRDLDAAHRERIDHHDGAAGRRGEHRDPRRPCADRADRRAAHQRHRLDQRFEAFDPRDAAIGQERARHIVLAGERAGVRDGKLARRRRAAELVGDDRLAARRGAEREFAQRSAHCGCFRGTADSRRCRGHRASRRKSRRPTDRPRCRSRRGPAKPTPRALPRDISAPIMVPECEAKKMRPTGMSGSAKAALAVSISAFAQIDDAEARRADHADAGLGRDLAQPLLARDALGAGLGEAGRQDGGDLHARARRIRRPYRSPPRSVPGYRRGPAPRAAPPRTARRARPAPCRALH